MFSSLLLVLSSAVAAEPPVAVSFQVASTELKVGDPLFVKIRYTNRTKEALSWNAAPTFDWGTLQVQVRPGGEEKYNRTWSKRSGSELYPGPMQLEPGESGFGVDVMLTERKRERNPWMSNPWLSKPGVYSLRAAFRFIPPERRRDTKELYLERNLIYSEPILVRVHDRPAKEKELIASRTKELRWGVSAIKGGRTQMFSKELAGLEANLGPSVMRTTLVWSRMIRDYDPMAPCAVETRAAIEKLRLTVDPATAEVMTICLASRLQFTKSPEDAIAVLEAFEDRNTFVRGIRSRSRAYIERAEKKKKKP